MTLLDQAERIAKEVTELRKEMLDWDQSVIYDLLRRAQYSTKADGKPTSTRARNGSRGTDSDAVLDAADARIRYDEATALLVERAEAQEAGDRAKVRELDRHLTELRIQVADPLRDYLEEIFGTLPRCVAT